MHVPDALLSLVTGTIINTTTIIAGGTLSLATKRTLSFRTQIILKYILALLTIYAGTSMTLSGFGGGFLKTLGQLAIVFLSLIIGNLIGKTLGIQRCLNTLGKYAHDRISGKHSDTLQKVNEGFVTCTILFCVGPMALLGALRDGLSGDFKILAVKSLMDGLATAAFVKNFSWGPILAAVPVFVYQGTLTLLARNLEPILQDQAMLDSINATGGLVILMITLVILNVKKVPLADYLPSLAVAPLLTWLF